MDNRKQWTAQQTNLRQLLGAKLHFDEAIRLFLQQHAAVHAAEISGGEGWSLQDEVLDELTDEQIRAVPREGENSIAWLLWHTTRIEDMTLNCLVFERPQLRESGDWESCLGLPSRDVGASMDAEGVAALSANVSVRALVEYRAAVGCSTRQGVISLRPEQLKEAVPDSSIQKFIDEGSISQQGHWLYEYYLGRTKGFFLTRTATSHNFIHLMEARRIRAKIEKRNA